MQLLRRRRRRQLLHSPLQELASRARTDRRVVRPALYMPDILCLGKQADARAAAGPAGQGQEQGKEDRGIYVHVQASRGGARQ